MTHMVDEIIACMTSNAQMADIQRRQTAHRIKLVEFWGIHEGNRVLEIGCGQGDTTAVLGHFVGGDGMVHGVDIASSNYGSPLTLGEARQFLLQSKLGKQIRMDFNFDLLSDSVDFPTNAFDAIVLSHCTWYFESIDVLSALLRRVRPWGKKLCIAEWDTRIGSVAAWPHLLAVLIQAQYESYKTTSESNVRTLFTPEDILRTTTDAGWGVQTETILASADLQDGYWEILKTLQDLDAERVTSNQMPEKMKFLLQSERHLLSVYRNQTVQSMPTYAFTAT